MQQAALTQLETQQATLPPGAVPKGLIAAVHAMTPPRTGSVRGNGPELAGLRAATAARTAAALAHNFEDRAACRV